MLVIDMKENIKMIKEKGKEYFIIMEMIDLKAINMKENEKMAIEKEKEFIIIKVVIDMMENLKMIYLKEKR